MVNLSSITKTSTQFLHLIGSTKLPLYAWYGAFLLLSGVDNCSMATVVDTVRSTKVIKKWNVILSDLIMQSQRDIPCWKDDLFLNMTTDSLSWFAVSPELSNNSARLEETSASDLFYSRWRMRDVESSPKEPRNKDMYFVYFPTTEGPTYC